MRKFQPVSWSRVSWSVFIVTAAGLPQSRGRSNRCAIIRTVWSGSGPDVARAHLCRATGTPDGSGPRSSKIVPAPKVLIGVAAFASMRDDHALSILACSTDQCLSVYQEKRLRSGPNFVPISSPRHVGSISVPRP